VLQDPYVFSGTIDSNIRLRNPAVSDERLRQVIGEVNLETFVNSLAQGVHEPVLERGASLSSGQKQLLSFARALAFNSRFLILDEATSSVDTDTEFKIREALSRMLSGHTSIVIAHRLSTIQKASRIVVMHKGQVRETGSHQQLLAQRGIYYKLYQLQYRDQELQPVGEPEAGVALPLLRPAAAVNGVELRPAGEATPASPSLTAQSVPATGRGKRRRRKKRSAQPGQNLPADAAGQLSLSLDPTDGGRPPEAAPKSPASSPVLNASQSKPRRHRGKRRRKYFPR
jgi:ABC-type multidrug transport system ATPase subunit